MRHLDFYRSTRPAHSSLWNMLSDVDSFFDRAMRVSDTGAADETEKSIAFAPRANVEETKDAYFLSFDLPGVKKEDLKIDVRARTISISGERKFEKREDTGFQRYECVSGTFERSFTVPEGVDSSRVDAVLADGVLRVTLPKSEAEKPRTIEIK